MSCKYYKEKKMVSADGVNYEDSYPLVTRRGKFYSKDCNNNLNP